MRLWWIAILISTLDRKLGASTAQPCSSGTYQTVDGSCQQCSQPGTTCPYGSTQPQSCPSGYYCPGFNATMAPHCVCTITPNESSNTLSCGELNHVMGNWDCSKTRGDCTSPATGKDSIVWLGPSENNGCTHSSCLWDDYTFAFKMMLTTETGGLSFGTLTISLCSTKLPTPESSNPKFDGIHITFEYDYVASQVLLTATKGSAELLRSSRRPPMNINFEHDVVIQVAQESILVLFDNVKIMDTSSEDILYGSIALRSSSAAFKIRDALITQHNCQVPCPYDTYSTAINATNIDDCQKCDGIATVPVGYEPGCGTQLATTTPFKDCQVGHYCPGGNVSNSQSIACPGENTTLTKGATSLHDCIPCPEGVYCVEDSELIIPKLCPPGHFCPLADLAPVPCYTGSWTDLTGRKSAEECNACAPGQYNCHNEGTTTPLDCPTGHFCAGNYTKTAKQCTCNPLLYGSCGPGMLIPSKDSEWRFETVYDTTGKVVDKKAYGLEPVLGFQDKGAYRIVLGGEKPCTTKSWDCSFDEVTLEVTAKLPVEEYYDPTFTTFQVLFYLSGLTKVSISFHPYEAAPYFQILYNVHDTEFDVLGVASMDWKGSNGTFQIKTSLNGTRISAAINDGDELVGYLPSTWNSAGKLGLSHTNALIEISKLKLYGANVPCDYTFNTPQPCYLGTYQNATGQSHCNNCLPGYDGCENPGSTKMSKCPGGYSCPGGAAHRVECDEGYFGNGTVCLPCPSGTFAENRASVECEPCPPGTYAPSVASNRCLPCPLGQCNSGTASVQCIDCPAATYYGESGCTSLSQCTVCPRGTYSLDGFGTCTLQCTPSAYNYSVTECFAHNNSRIVTYYAVHPYCAITTPPEPANVYDVPCSRISSNSPHGKLVVSLCTITILIHILGLCYVVKHRDNPTIKLLLGNMHGISSIGYILIQVYVILCLDEYSTFRCRIRSFILEIGMSMVAGSLLCRCQLHHIRYRDPRTILVSQVGWEYWYPLLGTFVLQLAISTIVLLINLPHEGVIQQESQYVMNNLYCAEPSCAPLMEPICASSSLVPKIPSLVVILAAMILAWKAKGSKWGLGEAYFLFISVSSLVISNAALYGVSVTVTPTPLNVIRLKLTAVMWSSLGPNGIGWFPQIFALQTRDVNSLKLELRRDGNKIHALKWTGSTETSTNTNRYKGSQCETNAIQSEQEVLQQ